MRRGTKTILWHLFLAGAALGTAAAWRWQLRWGATAAEQRRPLPGDDEVPMPSLQTTRAIGIGAPPAAVWPWVVQIGQDKAGFYTYSWLERVAGLDTRTGEAVVPEWQRVEAGDAVALAEGLALKVVRAEGDRALVLTAPTDAPATRAGVEFSWSFALEPEGPTGTRLVVRERYAWSKWRIGLAIKAVAWAGFAVNRAMLLGIRDRAERAWRQDVAASLDDAVSDVLAPTALTSPVRSGAPAVSGGGTASAGGGGEAGSGVASLVGEAGGTGPGEAGRNSGG
ncbi:MAG: hypothetical protein LBE08_03305 [Bifidobacteriaceae bacterium]|jgi:hypothetical protein|nr:hypothetical protein [Bifidobacteriaceae bacterium]